MSRYPLVRLLVLVTLLGSVPIASADASTGQSPQDRPVNTGVKRDDIVARVGDQAITFEQLTTMINSSAVVGLSLPGLGTPERDLVRIELLDKVISADLLYLDALNKGLDKDPEYQRAIQDFSNGMLSGLYRDRYVLGDIEVSDEEVQEFFANNIKEGTEFTDDIRMAIEATLRNRKAGERKTRLREIVREDVEVVIHEDELDPEEDEVRYDTDVVATIDQETLTWGEVKQLLGNSRNAGSMENRLKALNMLIDNRIMAMKGRAAGLQQDPGYWIPVNQFKKVRLINMNRARLVEEMDPSAEEVHAYYKEHRDEIQVPERRRVQMIVVKTKEEAEEVKRKIETGEMTMYQAAADYSIVPDAGKTLGRMGWVKQGSGFPELDKVTFSTLVNVIGGPVESPAGWHLVRTLEKLDAVNADIEDDRTQKATRRLLIKNRIDDYVVKLREQDYPVEIYGERINELAQKEVDWYKTKAPTEKSPEEVLEQIEKLRGME